MPIDKVAVLSGGIGLLIFAGSVLLAAAMGSFYPLIFGFFFMIVAMSWRYVYNELTKQQSFSETRNIIEAFEGKQKLDEMKELIQCFNGDRRVYEGAELYINTIKYYLSKDGVTGLTYYVPKNFQTLEPYGLFVMEIEADAIWDRPQIYAMLSITGPHAGMLVGKIYRSNWDQAMDYISEQGNVGLLPAKLMEVKSPLVKAAMESSLRQQFAGGLING